MVSSVPRTREHLIEAVTTSYADLQAELERGGPRLGSLVCVDGWTVKQLLVSLGRDTAVRCWWSEAVVSWVRISRAGGDLNLPAPG